MILIRHPDIVAAVHQGERWTGNDGVSRRIEDMTDEHVENLIRWLRERAGTIQAMEPRASTWRLVSSGEYIESTELMRALRARSAP